MVRSTSLERGGEGGGGSKRLLAILLVVVAAAIVAYLFLTSGPKPPQGPAQPLDNSKEILNRALGAVKSTTTHEYEMFGSISLSSRVLNIAVSFIGNGAMDLNAKRMRFSTEWVLPSIGNLFTGGKTLMETYVIGNTIYSSTDGSWVKLSSEEDLWAAPQGPMNVMNLLTTMDSKTLGTETMDGKQAYKIQVVPNIENMIRLLETVQPQSIESITPLDKKSMDELKRAIKELSATLWIDKVTYYPIKVELKISLLFKDVDLELGRVADINLDMNFTLKQNFGEPVSIVLPAAAQNATSVGSTAGF